MGGTQSSQVGGADNVDKFKYGGGKIDGSDYTGAPTDIFAILHEYLASQRTRALELFREFDRNRSGDLDKRELTNLVLRLMPDVSKPELKYFQAMIDIDGDGRTTFAELNEMVKVCRQAGAQARTKQLLLEDMKLDLRNLVHNSRTEAIRLFHEFDLDRSGYLEHSEVVRMMRFLKPSVSLSDLRFLLANLFIIDVDEDGRVSVEELLHELGLSPPEPALPPPSPPPPQPVFNPPPQAPTPEPEPEPEPIQMPTPPPPQPVPARDMATQALPKSAKDELRAMVQMHKEHENRLKGTMAIAQEAMAAEGDELRRDKRKLEDFNKELGHLSGRIEAAGLLLEEELKRGFQKVREELAAREQALLSQAADLTAERLALIRDQVKRTNTTELDVQGLIAIVEYALEEKDPYIVLQQSDRFETSLEMLRASGRTRELEAATTDELGLFVDFDDAVDSLRSVLDFIAAGEGVPGTLRGGAAMRVLREVFESVDHDQDGKIDKGELMSSLQRDGRVLDMLKLPTIASMHLDGSNPELFEEVFRRIDLDRSRKLSWPEFASFFGRSFFGSNGEKPPVQRSKVELVRDVSRLTAEAQTKQDELAESTREAERLALMLSKAEAFAAQQAAASEKRFRALQEEAQARDREHDAKLKAVVEENAAKQAEFEARLQAALERSEAVLVGRVTKNNPPDEERALRGTAAGTSTRPSSAMGSRPMSAGRSRPGSAEPPRQLYNNRAVSRDDRSKDGVGLRLQAAGQKVSRRM